MASSIQKHSPRSSQPGHVELPNTGVRIRDYIITLIALISCGLFIHVFNLEAGLNLPKLFPLIISGFAINAILPLRYRLPFLFLLNAGALFFLFGWQSATLILILGLALIGISHLSFKLPVRILLILIVALIPASLQLGIIEGDNIKIVATVLGSLFMFRLFLYLYEIRFEKQPVSIWKRINYFFLLPNLVFFLFPVVDYKTFTREYYSKAAAETYRKGLRWIIRGMTHLMAYRLIYFYLVPSPEEISGLFSLVIYLVTSYALILRLSGFFHFSAGVICLFGFDLPTTFHNYFLADGFSDLWRRINIYWKDFVMKVFYFPIFFKFKKRNNTALFITILIVFVINWFLHAYQWFWIRGSFPVKTTDILFWAIFGIAIAFNSIYQKNKKSKVSSKEFGFSKAIIRACKVFGMLIFMCLLYTFWISDSAIEWFTIIRQGQPSSYMEVLQLGTLLLGALLLASIVFFLEGRGETFEDRISPFSNPQIIAFTVLLGLLSLAGTQKYSSVIGTKFNFDPAPVLETKLNRADQERLFRGYYETIVERNDIGSNVADLNRAKPENWDKLHTTGIVESYESILEKGLKPNQEVIFKEALLKTNEHGLRDHSYDLEKPPSSLRIALLGTSIEMGSGVENEDTYENQLETMLNQNNLWPGFQKIEIINFGISGIHMPQQVAIAAQRIPQFDPDILIYTAHPNEENRALRKFALLYMKGLIGDYPELVEIGKKAGVKPDLSITETLQLLRPYSTELIQWGLRKISETAKEYKMIPIWVFIPSQGEKTYNNENEIYASYAESLGFISIDISGALDGYTNEQVAIRPWDRHLNKTGHRLVAEAIFEALKNQDTLREMISQTAGSEE